MVLSGVFVQPIAEVARDIAQPLQCIVGSAIPVQPLEDRIELRSPWKSCPDVPSFGEQISLQ